MKSAFLVALLLQGAAIPWGEPTPVQPDDIRTARIDYDARKLAEKRERDEASAEGPGKKLFASRCGLCHDPKGRSATAIRMIGPWLDAELVTRRGDEAVRNYILNGSAAMPGFKYQWEPARVDQIITYMKSITPDQRPQLPAPAAPQTAAAPAAPANVD